MRVANVRVKIINIKLSKDKQLYLKWHVAFSEGCISLAEAMGLRYGGTQAESGTTVHWIIELKYDATDRESLGDNSK